MKARFQADLKESMKAKDSLKLNTVRSLIAALQYEEMQKGREMKAEEVVALLKNEIKKRKESLEFAEKASRPEEIESLTRESQIIESYLPKQMSSDEMLAALNQFKSENPAANMGLAMKFLKDNFAGLYDGKTASDLSKQIFG
jgi:uncharacterized protein YqeY